MSEADTFQFLPSSAIETVQHDEVILKENPNRWVMFPIEFDSFWAMYKEVENNFWAAEDFIFSEDKVLLSKFPQPLLDCFKKLLSYHLMLDNTLTCRPADLTLDLLSEVQVAEARAFYGFQLTDENVHSETVGSMFLTLGGELDTSSGEDKISWLYKELKDSKCFFKKVLLVVVSKLLFDAAFVVFKDFLVRENLLPTFTNALDSMKKDRQIHVRFASCVFRLLRNKLLESEVKRLVTEACKLELDFSSKTLPLDFMNLKPEYLKSYLESCANNVLLVSNYEPLYKPDYKLDWLVEQTVDFNIKRHTPKTFDKNKVETTKDIKFDEDF